MPYQNEALLTAALGEVFHLSYTQVDDEMFMSLDSSALRDRTVDLTLDQAEAWHVKFGNILTEARNTALGCMPFPHSRGEEEAGSAALA